MPNIQFSRDQSLGKLLPFGEFISERISVIGSLESVKWTDQLSSGMYQQVNREKHKA